jgi:predicted  nucleic acid-binding Zn-ribbon protein
VSRTDDAFETLGDLVQKPPTLNLTEVRDGVTQRAFAALTALQALRQEFAAALERQRNEDLERSSALRMEIGELRAEVKSARKALGKLRNETTAAADELKDSIADLAQHG